jgi:hypothetical protein
MTAHMFLRCRPILKFNVNSFFLFHNLSFLIPTPPLLRKKKKKGPYADTRKWGLGEETTELLHEVFNRNFTRVLHKTENY